MDFKCSNTRCQVRLIISLCTVVEDKKGSGSCLLDFRDCSGEYRRYKEREKQTDTDFMDLM